MDLLFHPATKSEIDNILSEPSQALLIRAPAGSGKGITAQHIVSSLLNISQSSVVESSKVKVIDISQSDKEKTISIDKIREINSFLKLRTTGQDNYRRAVIIEHAETMGIEAQNAFLKSLEEPPKDTLMVLTTNNSELLLPTILSRVQILNIQAPTKNNIVEFFQDKYSPEEIDKAYMLAEGALGLITAILEDQKDHPLIAQIELAKDIYRKPVFERLNMIDNIVKTVDIYGFLVALERVSHAALVNAANRKDKSVEAWNSRVKIILESQNYLQHNPNSKLLLSNLFINL